MRHLHPSVAIGLIALLLAGCFGGGASLGPTESAAISTPRISSTPATSDKPEGSQPSAEPIPSENLEPFTCDLAIHEDATVARANITDIRVGTHADYDRVVFEFADGLPEMTLDRAEPPFTQDASGMPIEVGGSSFLRLTMRGGTKQTEENTSSYDGPIEFESGFSTLVHLVEGGDFEAQSTWYFGLSSEACVRVLTLTDDGAPRLVIDVEH